MKNNMKTSLFAGLILGLGASFGAAALDTADIPPITNFQLGDNMGTAAGTAESMGTQACARSVVKNFFWALNQAIPSNATVDAALPANTLEGVRSAITTLGYTMKLFTYSNEGSNTDGVSVLYGDEQPRQMRQPFIVKMGAANGCPWIAAKSPTHNGSYWQIAHKTNSLGVITDPLSTFVTRVPSGRVSAVARNGDWVNYIKPAIGYVTSGTNWTDQEFWFASDGQGGGCMDSKADTPANWNLCGFNLWSERKSYK